MLVQISQAAAAPVQHHRALYAFDLYLLDHGFDGREAGARRHHHDGFGRFFAQKKSAERAFDAQDVFFLHRREHRIGEHTAGRVAYVQFNRRFFRLHQWRIRHRVGAPQVVGQQKFDVLPRLKTQRVVGGQLKCQQCHVGRELFQFGDAHRHFPDRYVGRANHRARFNHHVGLRGGAAGQRPTGFGFIGTECACLMRAVQHAALQQAALARATGTVFAAVGQTDALAHGGAQDGFVSRDLETAPTGLNGDGE